MRLLTLQQQRQHPCHLLPRSNEKKNFNSARDVSPKAEPKFEHVVPQIPSICVGAPSSLGSSCRCWSPRRGREIFSVPDSLLRRRLSSAQSRRKKLGAHRIRCSCAYNSVQNNRLWALLQKNVADGGGGPMNESLPPTEPALPAKPRRRRQMPSIQTRLRHRGTSEITNAPW